MKNNRKAEKNELANKKYGKSYDSLCSDRKRIIDQLFILNEMEKQNKGCK
jgi:hypothetical protein